MTEPTSPEGPTSPEDYAQLQAVEYGTYRAKRPIFYNGALAFNVGAPVPVSHVERYHYDEQDLVEKVDDVVEAEDVTKPAPGKPAASQPIVPATTSPLPTV